MYDPIPPSIPPPGTLATETPFPGPARGAPQGTMDPTFAYLLMQKRQQQQGGGGLPAMAGGAGGLGALLGGGGAAGAGAGAGGAAAAAVPAGMTAVPGGAAGSMGAYSGAMGGSAAGGGGIGAGVAVPIAASALGTWKAGDNDLWNSGGRLDNPFLKNNPYSRVVRGAGQTIRAPLDSMKDLYKGAGRGYEYLANIPYKGAMSAGKAIGGIGGRISDLFKGIF